MSSKQGPSGTEILNVVVAIASAYGTRKLISRRKKAQAQVAPYVNDMLQIREAQRQEEAEQPNEYAAAAARARHNQQYLTMVSNVAQLKHQAAMGVIGNMKPVGR